MTGKVNLSLHIFIENFSNNQKISIYYKIKSTFAHYISYDQNLEVNDLYLIVYLALICFFIYLVYLSFINFCKYFGNFHS